MKLNRTTFISILLGLLALHMDAIPARKGTFSLSQPDGRSFQAMLQGDEKAHILMTAEGAAILKNEEDGFYCYAAYHADGTIYSTGRIVGQEAAPSESRAIPYDIIHSNAQEKYEVKRPPVQIPADTKAGPSIKHGLVILVEFQDLRFQYTLEDFHDLICATDSKSVTDYFNNVFRGVYEFQFDVYGIVTLSQNYAYYGRNNSFGSDAGAYMMINDACIAVGKEIDFAKYDDDGDGEVDNVFIYYAGPDEADGAGDDYIWSHQWYLRDGAEVNLSLGGKTINCYACASELKRTSSDPNYMMATIGTFCHEYSHTFGLPDYYDTDYEGSGGISEALWHSIDLMDGGNMNDLGRTPPCYNAVSRYLLGLSDPLPLTPGRNTLNPIQETGEYYLVETDNEGEVFLFECRTAEGWDTHLGGEGLLIYHVDRSERNAGRSDSKRRVLTAAERWKYSEINCRPSDQCVDLIEADPSVVNTFQPAIASSDYTALERGAGHVFFPYRGNNSFSPFSNPPFRFSNGSDAPLSITNIEFNGHEVTFFVFKNDDGMPDAIVDRNEVNIFQDAAIIRWDAGDPDYIGYSYIRWDNMQKPMMVAPYQIGKYSYTIEGLQPKTGHTVEIYFMNSEEDEKGNVNKTASFTTKSKYSHSYPFIWLNSKVERNADGSFPYGAEIPLRVYSKDTPAFVEWTLDGEKIQVEKNGYYTVTSSGTLKAVITYPDGSKDIITKTLTVK